jgi:hypothetical protein
MSRAFVRAVAVLALAGVAVGGCSVVGSDSSPGQNASSGAGTPGRASGSGLAAPSSGDAAGAANGGDDAGGESSVDWCAAQATAHLLCEDFDQGVPGKLTSRTYGGGTVAADVSASVSGPESMWASTPALFGRGANAGAFATASFVATNTSRSRLQAEFQVAADCVATQDGVTLVTLGFDTYSVSLVATSGASEIVEQVYAPDGGLSGSAAYPLTSQVPKDLWSLVVLEVDLSAKTASVTLSADAVPESRNLSLEPSLSAPVATTLDVGAAITNDVGRSPGCQLRVDSVLFDLL